MLTASKGITVSSSSEQHRTEENPGSHITTFTPGSAPSRTSDIIVRDLHSVQVNGLPQPVSPRSFRLALTALIQGSVAEERKGGKRHIYFYFGIKQKEGRAGGKSYLS